MKTLCPVKRVIDPDVKVSFDSDGELDLSNVEYKLNSFDEYSVEEALRIAENHDVDEIVVVSVGTQDAVQQIRAALAMGCHRGILVEIDDEDDLDALNTAQLLAGVIEDEEPDIVLMGKLAVDGENNQVAQMLAELLEWPQATFAFNVDVEGESLLVGREVDGGTADVRVKLPAIVSADLRLNEPRYASLPGIIKARKKPLDTIPASDLLDEVEPVVRTIGYELPPEREAGQIVEDVDELVDKLHNDAKVI